MSDGRKPLKCPEGFKGRYKVEHGDTMFEIAQRFNLPLDALINANPHIFDPDKIFPGDVLCVPVLKALSTGPLAVEPLEQTGVGVIVQNNTSKTVWVRVLLIDKTSCPKKIFRALKLTIHPGCLFIEAFPVWATIYEVQVEAIPGILVSIYGLGMEFRVIGGNTLRHSELIVLDTSMAMLSDRMQYESVTASGFVSGWENKQD